METYKTPCGGQLAGSWQNVEVKPILNSYLVDSHKSESPGVAKGL